MHLYLLLLQPLIILSSLSCYIAQPIGPVDFTIGEPFTLKYGKQAYFAEGNLTIGFSELIGDGRCPSDLMCFWEGLADIRVWVKVSRAVPDTVELSIYGYTMAADTMRHQSATVRQYKIVLMQLDPYPNSRIRISRELYTALLRVDLATR
jgi:hypothetical protein